MDVTAAFISAVVAALTAGLVTATPALYRLLSGRARSMRQDLGELLRAHERLEASLQARLDSYLTRLDARENDIAVLERQLGESQGRAALLETRVRELEDRLNRLLKPE